MRKNKALHTDELQLRSGRNLASLPFKLWISLSVMSLAHDLNASAKFDSFWGMSGKTPKDDFWMMLKVVPVIVSVVFLHQFYSLPFCAAMFIGVPTHVTISRCLVPFTRRSMAKLYAFVLDERLNERPVDAGCGATVFIFFIFILLAYHML